MEYDMILKELKRDRFTF